jgi:hypothetical protein
MDALAVSIAGQGRFVGLAPLGTSLTEEQARQLAHTAHAHQRRPIVATDADLAGQIAAQRDYWLLAQHGLDPQTVALRPGSDPAEPVLTCAFTPPPSTLRGTRGTLAGWIHLRAWQPRCQGRGRESRATQRAIAPRCGYFGTRAGAASSP